MRTLLLVAIRNLFASRRRSLLLGGAIAVVTLLLATLSAVSNGMQTNMLKVATTLSTGHVNVAGFYKLTSGDSTPMVNNYSKLLEKLNDPSLGIDHYVVRGRGWGKMISDVASQQGVLVGVDIEKEHRFREVVQVLEGNLEDLKKRDAVMLFKKQADRLEVKVGDPLTLSSPTFRGVNNTVDVTVVAIVKDMGMTSAWSFFFNDQAHRRLYQMGDDMAGAIHLFLKDPKRADEVAATLRKTYQADGHRVMEPAGLPFWQKFQSVAREDWTGQKIDVTTWTDEMLFMRYTLQTFGIVTMIFITVLLGMIILGVVNTLYIAIRERTREIGTLRAIGMARRWVLGMFVIETATLAFAATTAGCLMAAALVAGLNAMKIEVGEAFQMFLMSDTLKLEMDVTTAVVSIVVIGTVTTIASLLPSWRAARKPPVTAIQHV